MTITPHEPVISMMETKLGVQDTIKGIKKNTIARCLVENWPALLSEFIATGFLVLFGCMTTCPLPGGMTIPPLYIPFGFGMIILMNIQIFGHISGAHMNPAVSLAAVIWGSMSATLGLFYAIAQCIGATVGFGLLLLLVAGPVTPDNLCISMYRADLTVGQVVGIEIVLTTALVFTCCGIWDARNAHLHDSLPIKFGLVVTALCIAGAHLSGSSMNPARSIAPAIWNGTWDGQWIYWVGPLIGSCVSSLIYKYTWKPVQASENTK